MKLTPFGFTGTIVVDNYTNILRRQNEFGVNTKALPLYQVDKVKLGKILNNKTNGKNMLQKLSEIKLITGVESIINDKEETVYFMGPDLEAIKKGLRQHVLPQLLQNSDAETHMGRHHYDDVPQEDIERLAENEVAEYKDFNDDDEEKEVFTSPARSPPRQQISYAAVVTPPKQHTRQSTNQTQPPPKKTPEYDALVRKLEKMNEDLMSKLNDLIYQNKQLLQNNLKLQERVRQLTTNFH